MLWVSVSTVIQIPLSQSHIATLITTKLNLFQVLIESLQDINSLRKASSFDGDAGTPTCSPSSRLYVCDIRCEAAAVGNSIYDGGIQTDIGQGNHHITLFGWSNFWRKTDIWFTKSNHHSPISNTLMWLKNAAILLQVMSMEKIVASSFPALLVLQKTHDFKSRIPEVTYNTYNVQIKSLEVQWYIRRHKLGL